MLGGTKTVEAPSKFVLKIRVAREGHEGYGPGDRLRVLTAIRRAARHLAAGVSSSRQEASRLELAMFASEDDGPPLMACVGRRGAFFEPSSHLQLGGSGVTGQTVDLSTLTVTGRTW